MDKESIFGKWLGRLRSLKSSPESYHGQSMFNSGLAAVVRIYKNTGREAKSIFENPGKEIIHLFLFLQLAKMLKRGIFNESINKAF